MTEATFDVCDSCRHGAHHDCAGNKERKCDCIVCEGERIGDQVVGEPGEPKHARLVDRLDPRPWRP